MGIDLSLVCDQPGYAISPHTDHPNKILTLLFYLPTSKTFKDLGTSIYAPKNPDLKYKGDIHHPFEEFNKLTTMPFIPNSVFGFSRSNHSFHGVEPVNDQETKRISINYTLWERQTTTD